MAPPFLQLSTIGNSLDDHHDLDSYDHHHHHHHHRDLFNYLEPQSSFSSTTTTTTSSLSSPFFLSPPQIHGVVSDHYYREPQSFQFQLLEADHIVSYGASYDHHDQALGDEKGDVINLGIDHINHELDDDHTKDHQNRNSGGENASAVKWMSSKMRIMRKMTNSDHQAISNMHNNTNTSTTTSRFDFEEDQKKLNSSLALGIPDSSSNTNPIRVCSDCHTTKTPLWRSGPKGPKSLCNACGIRQRKARRAMAAAAAAANGTVEAVPSLIKTSKVKLKDNKTIPFKKRCHKLAITPSPKRKSKTTKIRFRDFSVSNNMDQTSGTVAPPPNAATTATGFQRVFPQDEKEAAILLMALSCGLVRG